jgi:hypothetical protein
VQRWFHAVTRAPEVEDIKRMRGDPKARESVAIAVVPQVLARDMMLFDKHGPLDLILYADSREEVRKTARNRIREMSVEDMERRLGRWCREVERPTLAQILNNEDIAAIAFAVANEAAQAASRASKRGRLLRSVECLAIDLAEAVCRPYSIQNLLSTSLFVFWSVDELIELEAVTFEQVAEKGRRLLGHYTALAVLLDNNSMARH